ncbi:MAG: hypothetical protein JWO67_6788, partial [Streptosporangiaceae bacterium]|nr:hypothetical protein [Streptosporangiaceae bacterium]
FIRTATPLDPWFKSHGLDYRACRAAVVIPRLPASRAKRRPAFQALCAAFGVEFIEVDEALATAGALA